MVLFSWEANLSDDIAGELLSYGYIHEIVTV